MKAFIFDMDGTIVDNMPFHHMARILLLNKYGVTLSREETQLLREGSFSSMIKQYIGHQVSDDEINALNMEKQLIYRMLYKKHIKEIQGLRQLLHESKKWGYSIALSTMGSSDNIDFVLSHLKVQHFFDTIVNGEQVKKGKPHPDIYYAALTSLNLASKNAVVFEDSHSGVLAALQAGLDVVGICTTYSKDEFKAWGVKHSIQSYDEYLEKYFN